MNNIPEFLAQLAAVEPARLCPSLTPNEFKTPLEVIVAMNKKRHIQINEVTGVVFEDPGWRNRTLKGVYQSVKHYFPDCGPEEFTQIIADGCKANHFTSLYCSDTRTQVLGYRFDAVEKQHYIDTETEFGIAGIYNNSREHEISDYLKSLQ